MSVGEVSLQNFHLRQHFWNNSKNEILDPVVSFRLQISQACRTLDQRPWKFACNEHFEHRGDDAHGVPEPCFSLSFELPTDELQVPKSRGAGDERETLVMDHRVNDSRNKSTMWFLMILLSCPLPHNSTTVLQCHFHFALLCTHRS